MDNSSLPGLTGKSLDDAKNALNGAEMALGPVTGTFSETAAAGTGGYPAPAFTAYYFFFAAFFFAAFFLAFFFAAIIVSFKVNLGMLTCES